MANKKEFKVLISFRNAKGERYTSPEPIKVYKRESSAIEYCNEMNKYQKSDSAVKYVYK